MPSLLETGFDPIPNCGIFSNLEMKLSRSLFCRVCTPFVFVFWQALAWKTESMWRTRLVSWWLQNQNMNTMCQTKVWPCPFVLELGDIAKTWETKRFYQPRKFKHIARAQNVSVFDVFHATNFSCCFASLHWSRVLSEWRNYAIIPTNLG